MIAPTLPSGRHAGPDDHGRRGTHAGAATRQGKGTALAAPGAAREDRALGRRRDSFAEFPPNGIVLAAAQPVSDPLRTAPVGLARRRPAITVKGGSGCTRGTSEPEAP